MVEIWWRPWRPPWRSHGWLGVVYHFPFQIHLNIKLLLFCVNAHPVTVHHEKIYSAEDQSSHSRQKPIFPNYTWQLGCWNFVQRSTVLLVINYWLQYICCTLTIYFPYLILSLDSDTDQWTTFNIFKSIQLFRYANSKNFAQHAIRRNLYRLTVHCWNKGTNEKKEKKIELINSSDFVPTWVGNRERKRDNLLDEVSPSEVIKVEDEGVSAGEDSSGGSGISQEISSCGSWGAGRRRGRAQGSARRRIEKVNTEEGRSKLRSERSGGGESEASGDGGAHVAA